MWIAISSVQSRSYARFFVTPWTAAHQASLSITNSWSLLKLMCIESVMPFNHLILSHPLLLPIFPSIKGFSNKSVLHIRWPKYWSFSFSISPSKAYSRLILSVWTGWISLQSKELSRVFSNTTFQRHQFFGTQFSQLSHPYTTTGKAIALTRWTFVGKEMSLLFNMLSRLVIAFLPMSKRLWIFMAAVTICRDFRAPQNKVYCCFHCFPISLPWSDGTRCHDLSFLNVEF